MSIYQPKRKTTSGIEEVTFPISAVDGLSEKIEGKTLVVPRIRVGAANDYDGTMVITENNPLIFAVEIIDGPTQGAAAGLHGAARHDVAGNNVCEIKHGHIFVANRFL